MAQPVPPVQQGTSQSGTLHPSPLAPSAAAVDRAAAPRLVPPPLSAPSLVGVPSATFDFNDKITDAYNALKQEKNPQNARTLFSEIKLKAELPGCAPEFAPGSSFYLNCLVGYAEAWVKGDESLPLARLAFAQIEKMITATENVQTPQQLQKYLSRLSEFVASSEPDQYKFRVIHSALNEKIESFSDGLPPPSHPHQQPGPRQVTPEGPIQGVIRRRDPNEGGIRWKAIFAFLAIVGLVGFAAGLYRRYVEQLNTSAK